VVAASEWFLLLASPSAAASPWVAKEIDFWSRHKPLDHLLLVQTDEEPRWVDARFAHTAKQATLRDPRFRDLVAEIASPLRGVPKDDLIGEDIRQYRRLNAWRNVAFGTVTLLFLGATVAAIVALQQRALAELQRDTAERNESQAVAALADIEAQNGSPSAAARLALSTLPRHFASFERPYAREAEVALLHSLLRLQEVRRFGHDSGVTSVALSPDGRTLATGSFDKTARLWEVATGREIAALKGHDAPVWSVAFSPDGRLLATGTQGKTAHLWDVASGSEIAALEGKDGFATAVAFSPDGRMLGTGSYDETYRLWDVSTRQSTASWRGQEAAGSSREGFEPSLAFSPDGRFVAAGSKDNTTRIWALETAVRLPACAGMELLSPP
jgi:WD domain, G-beta repeat